jgi:hypothetical protein
MFGTQDQKVRSTGPAADCAAVEPEDPEAPGLPDVEDEQPATSAAAVSPANAAGATRYSFMERSTETG